jgi:hypothetical protein
MHPTLSSGEVPEWPNGAVSKTVEGFAFRGFESLPLRRIKSNRVPAPVMR